ncbi:hypothetical protein LSA01_03790 [Latilactobacillus sakei]|jgi:type IV secretory pathway VirB2 component (pilin)|uniref:hypothetical protein n=1 Tax=Latilactobacillus sakei TaxID=1599 RepID=UPI000469169A|nr:hypothetical protein [Latilactobacillus sakei]AYG17043.1 hypothetical protein CFK78_08775 [Latilactobacillus sakei]AYG25764.1 hypothetical protein CFM83_06510 [Latilactobacillus sakei]AYG29857.1 hypothetical protein CFK76_02105 [Latilactobacillus sakei]AYG32682.1 hypothetical protein CFN54_07205 [Latilactobacillus sakei]KRK71514.1 hypothetical protein FD49_GL000958 [Latilactobacillus sakei subsp. sakei DSM 20017 = JCM 1157]
MKLALYKAIGNFATEVIILGIIYFGLVFLKVLPLDINWWWLLTVLTIIFVAQFGYFYLRK